jgi:hypothetical protein
MECLSRLQHHAVPRTTGERGETRPFCQASNQTGSFHFLISSLKFAASARGTFSQEALLDSHHKVGVAPPRSMRPLSWKRDRSVLERPDRLFGEQGFVELRVWGACRRGAASAKGGGDGPLSRELSKGINRRDLPEHVVLSLLSTRHRSLPSLPCRKVDDSGGVGAGCLMMAVVEAQAGG